MFLSTLEFGTDWSVQARKSRMSVQTVLTVQGSASVCAYACVPAKRVSFRMWNFCIGRKVFENINWSVATTRLAPGFWLSVRSLDGECFGFLVLAEVKKSSKEIAWLPSFGKTGSFVAHAKRALLGCVFQTWVLVYIPSFNLYLETTGVCLKDGYASSNTIYPWDFHKALEVCAQW